MILIRKLNLETIEAEEINKICLSHEESIEYVDQQCDNRNYVCIVGDHNEILYPDPEFIEYFRQTEKNIIHPCIECKDFNKENKKCENNIGCGGGRK